MKPLIINSIAEFHKVSNLPAPEHPLISVVDYAQVAKAKEGRIEQPILIQYYSISAKRGINGRMRYGQTDYDFNEGIMYFMAPGQVLNVTPVPRVGEDPSGWILLIHPDFLWNTPLAKKIREYEFFDYSVNEALFLSDKEEKTINSIVENIKSEYHARIDKFTQGIIIAQIETLLNYADRFYQRQFVTRKVANHRLLDKMEEILHDYFRQRDLSGKGLPSVNYLADALSVSPKYLSSLLKSLTGLTAQQHIHEKLINHAKEKLSTTEQSVSEIAYQLGFEHPQSFSKLFKLKTKLSPLEFRQQFN